MTPLVARAPKGSFVPTTLAEKAANNRFRMYHGVIMSVIKEEMKPDVISGG